MTASFKCLIVCKACVTFSRSSLIYRSFYSSLSANFSLRFSSSTSSLLIFSSSWNAFFLCSSSCYLFVWISLLTLSIWNSKSFRTSRSIIILSHLSHILHSSPFNGRDLNECFAQTDFPQNCQWFRFVEKLNFSEHIWHLLLFA